MSDVTIIICPECGNEMRHEDDKNCIYEGGFCDNCGCVDIEVIATILDRSLREPFCYDVSGEYLF